MLIDDIIEFCDNNYDSHHCNCEICDRVLWIFTRKMPKIFTTPPDHKPQQVSHRSPLPCNICPCPYPPAAHISHRL